MSDESESVPTDDEGRSWRVQPRDLVDRAAMRVSDWRYRPDVAEAAGSVVGAVRSLAGWVWPSGPHRIDGYRSFGDAGAVEIVGRVLARPAPGPAEVGEHGLRSAGRMAGRFITAEVAGVEVEVCHHFGSGRAISDDEGYFTVGLERPADHPPWPSGWSTAQARVLDEEWGAGRWWPIDIVTVGPEVDRILISDVDDTILVNGTGDAARTVLTTLAGSEHTRLPVLGAAELYRAITGCVDPTGPPVVADCPVFYVSSSPWNLYDFLVAFLAINRFPRGPLLLRDIGLNRRSFSDRSHRRHKIDAIADVLQRLPQVQAVLIGDTSLQDADAFAEIIDTHPGRIAAVYLREVDDPERTERARMVVDGRPPGSVPMVVVRDMIDIAVDLSNRHAD